jgi:hypothetical protein
MKINNLVGNRFGNLLVISRAPNAGKATKWLCLCDCGKIKSIRALLLVTNKTVSCGCYRKKVCKKMFSNHGMSNSSEYSVWQAMKRRCYDKNNKYYDRYGGRGVTVCDRWVNSFENFYSDMGKRPKNYSIDRIDVNGNYSPENCKWSDSIEQANNKSTNSKYLYGEENLTISQWARKAQISPMALRQRLNGGIPLPWALYNIDYRSEKVEY